MIYFQIILIRKKGFTIKINRIFLFFITLKFVAPQKAILLNSITVVPFADR